MQQVLLQPDAGLLSAYGIGMADVVRHARGGVYRPYSPKLVAELDAGFDRLTREAPAEVLAEGVAPDRIEIRRSLGPALSRLDACADGPRARGGDVCRGAMRPSTRSSTATSTSTARWRSWRRGSRSSAGPRKRPTPSGRVGRAPARGRADRSRLVWRPARSRRQVFIRERLRPGDRFTGPAIVREADVDDGHRPGWRGEMLGGGELLLSRPDRPRQRRSRARDRQRSADPVMLEVFNNHFAGIAEQMGITLRNTASSVNVKERLDFSCAMFTAGGRPGRQRAAYSGPPGRDGRDGAPRPGRQSGAFAPGDVFVTNDPYRGGSHLPDVTVVTPVHDATADGCCSSRPAAPTMRRSAASRPARCPRSRAPGRRRRADPQFQTGRRRAGRAWTSCGSCCCSGPYPDAQCPRQSGRRRRAGRRQSAGRRDLLRLVERYSLPVVAGYMGHIQDAAEQKMRPALARLPGGTRSFRRSSGRRLADRRARSLSPATRRRSISPAPGRSCRAT